MQAFIYHQIACGTSVQLPIPVDWQVSLVATSLEAQNLVFAYCELQTETQWLRLTFGMISYFQDVPGRAPRTAGVPSISPQVISGLPCTPGAISGVIGTSE